MRIEILCTGDEVLGGKIVNSNFSMISRKLEDVGLAVLWGTTVGDDRETLLAAFRAASERADAVIVNGGLGPTVDDLSQETAARAAGVPLVLDAAWLERMESYFRLRGREMPPNNRKQAMLPAGAEVLDNPIGTACGFALDVGRSRFFFTPGVPRELRRMLDEQVVPRLLARSGRREAIVLKRFHSYGLGESRVDAMLDGVEALAPDGAVKLGFRAHYPQLETKLLVRGRDDADVAAKLAPVEAAVRARLGNFILCEDDDTLEARVLALLGAADATLAVAEVFTGGRLVSRLLAPSGAGDVMRRAIVAADRGELARSLVIDHTEMDQVAAATRAQAGTSHALAVHVYADDRADGVEFGGDISIALATPHAIVTRRARLVGGRDWVRLGAVEMALDVVRRHLLGLPVDEKIDFEKR